MSKRRNLLASVVDQRHPGSSQLLVRGLEGIIGVPLQLFGAGPLQALSEPLELTGQILRTLLLEILETASELILEAFQQQTRPRDPVPGHR